MKLDTATPAQREAITTERTEVLAVAGPGSGKTATLIARILRIIQDGTPPEQVAAITFTNAGANEIDRRIKKWAADTPELTTAEREAVDAMRLGFVGTLHSFALRMLKEHGGPFGYGDRISIISPESASDLLASKAKSLGCKTPMKDLLALKAKGRPARGARMDLAVTVVSSFLDDLKEAGVVDYDVLLQEFLRALTEDGPASLGFGQAIADRFAFLFVDEVQDSAPIDWDIYRALSIRSKFLVGDPDQCQPAGTMVRMSDGITSCPIESLKVGDKVMTYARQEKMFLKNGVVSSVASRPYRGPIYAVKVGEAVTFCTPNHRWLIKWPSGKQRTADNWCVYLMRRGDHFRVGKTRFFRGGAKTDMIIGLPLRMRQEHADSGWVLKVHATEGEATAYEQIVAATYGLPEACFRSNCSNTHFTQEVIDAIFAGIPGQLVKAARCLHDHGRDIDYPLFDRSDKRTRRTVQEIRACNIISGVMSVPVASAYDRKNRAGKWDIAEVAIHAFSGLVYSLDVTPHHKYVANGIVTCNSIYAFRGGRVREMVAHGKDSSVLVVKLEENFRSRAEICAGAQSLIEHNRDRLPKVTRSVSGEGGRIVVLPPCANPGEEMGVVARKIKEICGPESDGYPIPSVAVLARTNAIADGFRQTLPASGIPIVEVKRSDLPRDWGMARAFVELLSNPENDALAFFYLISLNERNGLDAGEARYMAHAARNRATMTGQSLNRANIGIGRVTRAEFAMQALAGSGVSREAQAIAADKFRDLPPDSTVLDLALALGEVREYAKEEEGDGVRVLTIHGAKGREFDVVFCVGFEDECLPGPRAVKAGEEAIEEERRLAYVAITRARTQLFISSCESRVSSWGEVQKRTPSRFISEIVGR